MADDTPTPPVLTWAEQAVAAIEESLMGALRAEWATMTISGKSLTRMTIAEKLNARDRLKGEIARSKRAKTSGFKTIGAIFV